MVDYIKAFKRPFTNAWNLLIGCVFEIVPLVNFIVLGYQLECSKGTEALPEWKDLKELFIKGVLAFVILVLYMLPALLIFFTLSAGLIVLFGLPALAALKHGDLSVLTGSLALFILAEIVLAFILFLPSSFLTPVALIAYERTRRFGEAFNFKAIFKKAFTKEYFTAWLVVCLYSIPLTLVGLVLSFFIPFVSVLPAYAVGVTAYTVYGEAYDGLEKK